MTETFAEKDQSKDLSQAIHSAKVIELPKRSEDPIEIIANYIKETARIEEDLNIENEISLRKNEALLSECLVFNKIQNDKSIFNPLYTIYNQHCISTLYSIITV